jgi:hypothetical protein
MVYDEYERGYQNPGIEVSRQHGSVGLYSVRLERDKRINPIGVDEVWLRRTTSRKRTER